MTLTGVYEDGQITFDEVPPFQGPIRVLVTLLDEADGEQEGKSGTPPDAAE